MAIEEVSRRAHAHGVRRALAGGPVRCDDTAYCFALPGCRRFRASAPLPVAKERGAAELPPAFQNMRAPVTKKKLLRADHHRVMRLAAAGGPLTRSPREDSQAGEQQEAVLTRAVPGSGWGGIQLLRLGGAAAAQGCRGGGRRRQKQARRRAAPRTIGATDGSR